MNDRDDPSGQALSFTVLLALLGWIAVKLLLVTAMLDGAAVQFIYAGF